MPTLPADPGVGEPFPGADAMEEGWLLLRQGQVTAINRAACAMLQVEAARAVGAPLMTVVRDHRIEEAVAEQQATELFTRGRQLQVVPFDGGLLLRDVTAPRKATAQSRELLAVLSHELRTPVTTIRSVLEALRYDLPEEQRQRMLARAEAESARLVRLLADLTVDVAPPKARSVVLAEVAAKVEGLLADTLQERAIGLSLEVGEATAWADPDKLLQVLLNLMENAALHGPRGAELRLVTRPAPGRLGWWLLEVLDKGAAVPPETMESWFLPHARGVSATSRGTGLGLSIVRSIAEAWGGSAWGRRWEEGNAFGVSLPADRASSGQPSAATG